MLLAGVVETSRRVADTSKRLEKIELLARLLRQLHPNEIEIVVPFLSGQTRQGRIGIGYAALRDARTSPAAVPSLEVAEVDHILESIVATTGSGSQRRRLELLQGMFARATEAEQQFLIGLLMGELRQGALEGIMVEAVAKASGLAAERVRRAAMMAGDIARVARAALEAGRSRAGAIRCPIVPADPAHAGAIGRRCPRGAGRIGRSRARIQNGRRARAGPQIGRRCRVYSRALNDVTAAVPEIVEVVRALPAKDLILDGEVISLQPDGRPQPFQMTMRRFGRKLDVDRMRAGAADDAVLVRPAVSGRRRRFWTNRSRAASHALSELARGI